jgi:DinB superfamily
VNANRISLLRWQLDIAWSLLELHLSDLTDEECFWEPAELCWTVRRDPDGHWVADWEQPEPQPFPIPSIAWLTWHIGFWWLTTYDHAFGTGSMRREDVRWPGDAESAVDWLRGCKTLWANALESLEESELDSIERSGPFMRGTRPFGYVVAWVNAELMKNAAEIGMVRNLCALRSA